MNFVRSTSVAILNQGLANYAVLGEPTCHTFALHHPCSVSLKMGSLSNAFRSRWTLIFPGYQSVYLIMMSPDLVEESEHPLAPCCTSILRYAMKPKIGKRIRRDTSQNEIKYEI